MRPSTKVTILCDDPVSKPLTVEGAVAFDLGSVRPGLWRVHAYASGYRASIVHFTGPAPAPAEYAPSDQAASAGTWISVLSPSRRP